jgi:phosphohistidine phosphatase
MKTVILIRHAKSSWDFPLCDIDRPLSLGGKNDAFLISSKINKLLPDKFVVWCSSAKRTQETCYIFAENLLIPIENIIFRQDLYTFDYIELYNKIRLCNNIFESIILFGHNDAITNFVNKFGNQYVENVPTTGVVQIEFEEDNWLNIKKGKVKNILFPKLIRSKI